MTKKQNTLHWHDESQTILVADIYRIDDWDDVYRVVYEQYEWHAAVDHRVHTIFHVHEFLTVPPRALANIQRLLKIAHPNEDLVLFVRAGATTPMLLNMVNKMYQIWQRADKFHFVDTFDEALHIIRRYEAHRDDDSTEQNYGVSN